MWYSLLYIDNYCEVQIFDLVIIVGNIVITVGEYWNQANNQINKKIDQNNTEVVTI